jgi:alkanesulfonate monooxygenase SsuD/methylene tetrahydromethanopterin reductase-like flavin-dependent oxidoreductase (luciferase family)
MRRAGRLGDGWIPSFIPPDRFAAGVAQTQRFAVEAGREVPADHFGTLVNFCFAPDRDAARRLAGPFIPRGRVDDATLERCTAFGPPALLRERLEEYAAAGGSKFIARPLCPPDRMLEQLARLAEEIVPGFHRR